MNEPLREVTNLESRGQGILQKGKKLPALPKIEELILVGLTQIHFGECIAGTVSQRKIGVTLREKQDEAKVISLSILYEDELLNELPEYIFGVRKQNAWEYFDEYKFKASQRGVYNFIVGVKTPTIYDYDVKGKLLIRMEGTQGTLSINLAVISRIPEIKCLKQLVDSDGMRLIKLGVVRNKSKRQTKVVFKCTEGIPITLQVELLGMQNIAEGQVDVKPKNFTVGGRGNFVLSFTTSCPPDSTLWSCLRRVLILRVKDTNMHFHFPLEVTFYAGESSQCGNAEFQ